MENVADEARSWELQTLGRATGCPCGGQLWICVGPDAATKNPSKLSIGPNVALGSPRAGLRLVHFGPSFKGRPMPQRRDRRVRCDVDGSAKRISRRRTRNSQAARARGRTPPAANPNGDTAAVLAGDFPCTAPHILEASPLLQPPWPGRRPVPQPTHTRAGMFKTFPRRGL